jgi:7-cyano-7-deazaguanine synthase
MEQRIQATVLFSGGIDSLAVAAMLASQGCLVEALHISYGQAAAAEELHAAQLLAKKLELPIRIATLRFGQRLAVGEIPGRNGFLLMTAMMSGGRGPRMIGIGVHAGTQYFDCSSAFISSMQQVFDGYTGGQLRIMAPFLNWRKDEIWQYCRAKGLPVDFTYSCEAGGGVPCGTCLSCRDREELNACSKLPAIS